MNDVAAKLVAEHKNLSFSTGFAVSNLIVTTGLCAMEETNKSIDNHNCTSPH